VPQASRRQYDPNIGRLSDDMPKFCILAGEFSLLCSLSLGLSAASALNENIADRYRLQWNDRSDGRNRPAILFPDGRLAKMNDPARR